MKTRTWCSVWNIAKKSRILILYKMPNCILRDCNNRTGSAKKISDGITFHKFPRPGQDERELWIKFVKENREEPSWSPSDHATVCSKHFQERDYYETPAGRRFLKKNAVPYAKTSLSSRDSMNERVLKKYMVHQKLLRSKNKKVTRKNHFLRSRNRKLKNLVERLQAKLSIEAKIDNENTLLQEMTDEQTYFRSFKKNERYNGKLLDSSDTPCTVTKCPALKKSPLTTKNIFLPHRRPLNCWYGSFKADPGFTEEAFIVLDFKSSITSENKPLLCSLVFNEMAIRQPKNLKHKSFGLVDFGTGPQEHPATEVIVFMLVSLTESWKIPVGYFLAAGATCEIKAKLIRICLEKCHKVRVRVVGLVIDANETNFAVVKELGCHLLKATEMITYFPHPSTFENVYIFIDPCHVLKLIRNTFENRKILFDENNNKVRWKLLVNLNKLQHNEFKNENKFSSKHMKFRDQVMKMKLSTQLLSMNITKALNLCNTTIKTSQFFDNKGTIYFITLINNLFDVLKSQRFHFYGYKSHICSGNKDNIFQFLNTVKAYFLKLQIQVKQIKNIKRPNGEPRIIMKILKKQIIDSECLTGFECAIICIESLKKLFSEIVEEKGMIKYVSMSRLSQEHLQLFFETIRQRSVGDNGPNVMQFRDSYKKNLNNLKLKSSYTGSTIPLDNYSILTTSSVNVINSTTSTYRFNTSEELISLETQKKLLFSDIQASINCGIFAETLNNEVLLKSECRLIVGYISGYVARKLMQELKCEDCIDKLTIVVKVGHHKLISVKDMGGLCYSSECVFQVCLHTEAFIKTQIRINGGENLPASYIMYIVAKTLESFLQSNIFDSMSFHSFQQPCTLNHRIHLLRAIIEKYTILRLQYEVDSKFHLFTSTKKNRKLVLFGHNALA